MTHEYTQVDYDGKLFYYRCSCGHVTPSKSGTIPLHVPIKIFKEKV